MNGNNETRGFGPAAFGDAVEAYVKFWTDFTSKMAAAPFAASPGSTPPEAMREVRSAMFKAMADSFDQYMRSPQFQDAMKQWLAQSIGIRSQMNDWAGRLHHEMQGVSRQDVDALVQAIGRLETRMSDGLQRISDRLDALEARDKAATRPSRGAAARRRTRTREAKS